MMLKTTKFTKCIALGLAISVTACQTNLVQEVMPTNSIFSNGRTEEIAKSYSGEELFRGIFMAEGEVADKISIFDKMPIRQRLQTNDSLKIKYKTELDEIVTAIKVEQPNFFTNFEKEITSGNVLKVQTELNYASKILIETLIKQPKYDKAFAKTDAITSKIDIAEVSTADGKVDMNKLEEIINKQKLEDSFNPDCAAVVFEVAIYVMVVVNAGIVWNAAVLINFAAMVNVHAGTNVTVTYGDFYNANGSGGGGVYTSTGVSRRTTKAQQPLNTSTIHGLQQEMFIAELTTTFKK
jgi:SdpC family antimicrobial peptide